MKFTLQCALCALSLITVSGVANAALEERLGGRAYYDTESNLTWLADANYAKTSGYVDDSELGGVNSNGKMTWQSATDWVASLTIGGKSDWRLPTTLQPDPNCSFQGEGESWGNNCTGGELGNMFYNILGGEAYYSITDIHDDATFELFSNIQATSIYWSSTEYDSIYNVFYGFDMNNGSLELAPNGTYTSWAWAVCSGDVSAVPVPAAVWLLGSGLLGLFGLSRRRSANV